MTRHAAPAITIVVLGAAAAAESPTTAPAPRIDGYRGIWWGQEPTHDEYHYKYSGGLGTYTAKHVPIAVYCEQANKTFFVYGGTSGASKNALVAMVSYYDHATRTVPQPVAVHYKNTSDPHDDPALMLDDDGYVWVFVSGRARARPGYIYRSEKPHAIDAFRRVEEGEFTYPQPWHLGGKGFLFLFTKYLGGRQLFWRTSLDGVHWSGDHPLATFGGHYQVSARNGTRVASAFNYHPGGNVDRRTNLYYVETRDFGRTWRNVRGEPVELPFTDKHNAALVHDFEADGRLVYLKDLNFDAKGRPVVLYVESRGWQPGPAPGLRALTTAQWDGSQWQRRPVATCDHNYDTGSLYVERDRWRVLAPTDPGPQPWHTGGEIVLWESRDEGRSWTRRRQVTAGSESNHTYVRRPVDARPDFYAFWADGDAGSPSPSRLYFTGHDAEVVYRLPASMTAPAAAPLPIAPASQPAP